MTQPFHARMSLTVEVNGDVTFHLEGCEACMAHAIAAGYDLSHKFRSLLRKACLSNTDEIEVRLDSAGNFLGLPRHWN